MTKICREAEASLDYYAMFKNILKQAPLPMSPLESLASSAVRTAHKVCKGLHSVSKYEQASTCTSQRSELCLAWCAYPLGCGYQSAWLVRMLNVCTHGV
jgi:hypothetical protein